jgi:hypothetical protein
MKISRPGPEMSPGPKKPESPGSGTILPVIRPGSNIAESSSGIRLDGKRHKAAGCLYPSMWKPCLSDSRVLQLTPGSQKT